MAKLKPFPTLLLAWDSVVPDLEHPNDLTKATSRYWGYEAIPGKMDWIRDFVELGPGGVEAHLPKRLSVPKSYWVPLAMLDWSITVNQHLRGRLQELAGLTNNKKRKNACLEWELTCLKRLWWYIRCRDKVRADLQGFPKSEPPPGIVGSLNELLWREWNNCIEDGVAPNMVSEALSAQVWAFQALFASNGGFIGELQNMHVYLLA